MADTMKMDIITAERTVFSADIELVLAPGVEGELGILPHHAGFMTILKPGELMIRKDGIETFFAISGGFMEVLGNHVSVLADACERSDEIDEERAEQAIQRAQERLANHGSEMELERAMTSLKRAQVRVNLVRRRRPRSGQQTPTGAST